MLERIEKIESVAGSEIGLMLRKSNDEVIALSEKAKETGKNNEISKYLAAQKALDKTLTNLEVTYGISFFKTLTDVHKFLENEGYLIAERTVYDHKKQGKLIQTNDGYLKSDVIKYAETHLKKKSAMGILSSTVSLAEQKIISEIEYKQKRTEREAVIVAELTGSLISKEIVGREFASRIEFIKRYFEDLVGSIPMLLVGKTEKEIRNILKNKFDYLLEQYSKELELVRKRNEEESE